MRGILEGMGLTFSHIFRPKVTRLYPYEKPKLPPRSRGLIQLIAEEGLQTEFNLKCESCLLCEKACPPRAITIEYEPMDAWKVRPWWQLMPSYSYLQETRWLPAPTPTSTYAWDGLLSSLKHQGMVRSQFDLGPSVQLDVMGRARSHNPFWSVPGALLWDVRLAWRPLRSSELSLTVRDLANRQVLESLSEGPTPAIPLRRTVVLKLTQRF